MSGRGVATTTSRSWCMHGQQHKTMTTTSAPPCDVLHSSTVLLLDSRSAVLDPIDDDGDDGSFFVPSTINYHLSTTVVSTLRRVVSGVVHHLLATHDLVARRILAHPILLVPGQVDFTIVASSRSTGAHRGADHGRHKNCRLLRVACLPETNLFIGQSPPPGCWDGRSGGPRG